MRSVLSQLPQGLAKVTLNCAKAGFSGPQSLPGLVIKTHGAFPIRLGPPGFGPLVSARAGHFAKLLLLKVQKNCMNSATSTMSIVDFGCFGDDVTNFFRSMCASKKLLSPGEIDLFLTRELCSAANSYAKRGGIPKLQLLMVGSRRLGGRANLESDKHAGKPGAFAISTVIS